MAKRTVRDDQLSRAENRVLTFVSNVSTEYVGYTHVGLISVMKRSGKPAWLIQAAIYRMQDNDKAFRRAIIDAVDGGHFR